MQEIIRSIARLKRHYDFAVQTYDHISLLDLIHALRVWCDLKDSVRERAPAFSNSIHFKIATPTRKLMRAAQPYPFVFCFFPDEVFTLANKGIIAESPNVLPGYDKYYTFIEYRAIPPKTSIRKIGMIAAFLDDHVIDELKKRALNPDIRRCNHRQWLEAEVAQWAYHQSDGQLKSFRLTREMLIRRSANTLGASHPEAADLSHEWDKPIHYLLGIKVLNLPLPYLILLKTAQDILECAARTFRV